MEREILPSTDVSSIRTKKNKMNVRNEMKSERSTLTTVKRSHVTGISTP
jgi:hypothetical protein